MGHSSSYRTHHISWARLRTPPVSQCLLTLLCGQLIRWPSSPAACRESSFLQRAPPCANAPGPGLSRFASSRGPRLAPAGHQSLDAKTLKTLNPSTPQPLNPSTPERPGQVEAAYGPHDRARRAAAHPAQTRSFAAACPLSSRPTPSTVADGRPVSRGEGPCCPHPSLAFFLDTGRPSAP